ncbi:MAG: AAA family ATPase [Myxococcota bacterium]
MTLDARVETVLDAQGATLGERLEPKHRPLVVELIGPAGSGKTTLARALCRRPDVTVGIELPRSDHVPHVIHHSLLLLPVFVGVGGDGGWLSWKEMRSMTYLRAWPRQLTRSGTKQAVTVLDHGPVFRLARLRAFGPRITRSASFERWWEASLGIWSGLLHAVIALDAPNEVLVDRIRSREEAHRIKAESRSEAETFLRRYRAAYHEILEKLEGGPQLLRVDTSKKSPEQVTATAGELLAQLAGGTPA